MSCRNAYKGGLRPKMRELARLLKEHENLPNH